MAELMFFNPAESFARGRMQSQDIERGRMSNALLRSEVDLQNQRPALIRNALTSGKTDDLFARSPELGLQVQEYLGAMGEQERAAFQQKHDTSTKLLAYVESFPEAQRAGVYQQVAPRINSMWGQEVMPSQYDPVAVGSALAQARSIEDILGGGVKDFDASTDLRKEFSDLTKDFRTQKQAYGRIQASAANPSAAGDLALIFNYMKLLDPNSVVRESEFATAENAGSVPDRVRAQYNKVLRGERLSEAQRKDFVARSAMLFNAAAGNHNELANRYRGFAEQRGAQPENVATLWQPVQVPEFTADQEPPPPDKLRPGMVIDGYRYKGGPPGEQSSWVKTNG